MIAVVLAQVLLAAEAGAPATWSEPLTGMEFVLISASRRAGIAEPFYLGRFEVTQDEWHRVMGSHPSHFSACGGRCPVENVNFEDISKFVGKLSSRSNVTLRLPTETEWEYACLAGAEKNSSAGDAPTIETANIDDGTSSARTGTAPVGTYAPNAWGLFDMRGNVWEWCSDWYRRPGAGDGGLKVIRGGSWHFGGDSARCGVRYFHRPADRGFSLGFRLARGLSH